MTDKNPLVSIIIITYNSEKYVLETLESAKAQTYQNIELVVSDDCSTDNTVEMCRNWIDENKERFVRTELVTADKNTGIASNCNRGLYVAKGEWVKLIAGDDLLHIDCITENINYVKNEPEAKFVFSNSLVIDHNSQIFKEISQPFDFFILTAKDQHKRLLRSNILKASSFIEKQTLLELGGFDERYTMLEDYPLWIKATKEKFKLYSVNKYLTFYREHENSIFENFAKNRGSEVSSGAKLNKSIEAFNNDSIFPNLLKRWYFGSLISIIINNYLLNTFFTNKSKYKLVKYLKLLSPNYITMQINLIANTIKSVFDNKLKAKKYLNALVKKSKIYHIYLSFFPKDHTLILVTGSDSSHFASQMSFLKSVCKYEPNILVIVYNLGFTSEEKAHLMECFPQYVLKDFEYHKYPSYFNIKVNAGEYAWKPVIINNTLKEYKQSVCWMDAGNLLTGNINALRRLIKKNGFYSPISSGTVEQFTHKKTLLFFNTDRVIYKYKQLSGGCIGICYDSVKAKNLSYQFAHLAEIKECIAPEGSNRKNHRQDQALLTLLAFKWKLFYYFPSWCLGFTFHNDIDKK